MTTERMNGYTDIHTHILPAVDDGAKDMAQALHLVRMAYKNGTRTIFLTPHYRGQYKKNDAARLREVFLPFCRAVQRELPDMRLYLGNEIHYEVDAPEQLAAGKILSLNDSGYCLLEFRSGALRSQIIAGVSEMFRCGYTPIIAHAERYEIFRKDKTLTDEVLNMGALIQLNADSVLGKNGLQAKRFCDHLLKQRQVHFIASDAHDETNRPPLLRECWWMIYKKYGVEYANRLFYHNAQAVVEDKIIY